MDFIASTINDLESYSHHLGNTLTDISNPAFFRNRAGTGSLTSTMVRSEQLPNSVLRGARRFALNHLASPGAWPGIKPWRWDADQIDLAPDCPKDFLPSGVMAVKNDFRAHDVAGPVEFPHELFVFGTMYVKRCPSFAQLADILMIDGSLAIADSHSPHESPHFF